MLKACGKATQSGRPTKPFQATDLDPEIAAHAKAICEDAAVSEGPLLDARMIDVAFTGTASAADIYSSTPEPVAVGNFKGASNGGTLIGGGGGRNWVTD